MRPEAQNPDSASIKVLLIEDNPWEAQLVWKALVAAYHPQFEVVPVDQLSKGLEVFDQGGIDVILLGLVSPDTQGLDAFRRVYARAPDVPIIVLTSSGDRATAIGALREGAQDYLSKSQVSTSSLVRSIVNAINRHRLDLVERLLREKRGLVEDLQHSNKELAKEVAERRLAEEALARLGRQHELILNSAGEGIYGLDLQGKITFVNPAASRITGWEMEDLLGQSAHAILHHSKPDGAPYPLEECKVYSAAKGGTVQHQDNEVFWRKDGAAFPVEYITSPVRDDQDRLVGAVVTFRDISERRAVERMKSEFVSVVSHELRTPLTSIRGSLGLIAGNVFGPLPDKVQHMVEIAVNNTDRLVRLINDILDIERIEAGRVTLGKTACDGAALILQAAEVMRVMAEKAGVTLSVSTQPVQLWADPDRIIQTLTNLLSNSIKFSPHGATVWLTAQREGNQVLFQVKDQGRGIPAGKLGIIFDRFEQVDASDAREKGGTGLGLAICRGIVEQHGGRIWVDSTLGRGSTFFFTLPASQEEGWSIPEPLSGGRTALTSDDDHSEIVQSQRPENAYV